MTSLDLPVAIILWSGVAMCAGLVLYLIIGLALNIYQEWRKK